MRQVGADLAAAIEAPEQTARVRLSVDWDGDGHGGAGSIDDLSGKAATVRVASVLQGTQPDQVSVVEGTAAATLDVDLAAGDTDDERLQAVRYFSPFAADSPLAGKIRLNRNVELDVELLTASGWQGLPLLRGVTRSLPVRVADRSAQLAGIDYRSRLRTLVALPAMAANMPTITPFAPTKPGLEGTWIVSYVLWRCGFPLSPPPPAGCRIWIPLHGSGMPFIAEPYRGSPTDYIEILPGSGLGPFVPLEFDTGPFVLATRPARTQPAGPFTVELMHVDARPAPGAVMFTADGRSSGRMTAWIKSGCQYQLTVSNTRGDGPFWSPQVVTTLTLTNNAVVRNIAGPIPPFDGRWHFVGVHWDDAAGTAVFNVDGQLTTVGFTPTPAAPGATDSWAVSSTVQGQVAELQVSTGLSSAEPWPPLTWDPPASVDRSALRLDGIVPGDPTEGWLILQELAAAEQGAVYLDPVDGPTYATRARLVSPAAQQVQRSVTADADLFDLAYDFSLDKIANTVTGTYQPIAVSSQATVWATSEKIVLGPGQTVTLLAQYTGLATTVRFVAGFGNTLADGTGTVYAIGSASLTQTLTALSEVSSRITVTNRQSVTLYLVASNGQPAVSLVADQVSQGSGANPVVVVDTASIADYDVQPLALPANRWVQRREFGAGMAMCIARDLGQPQPVFAELPIPGDPRLQYFDRLAVVDDDNTGADVQVWTVGLTHSVDGAQYETRIAARPARNRFVAGADGRVGVDLVG